MAKDKHDFSWYACKCNYIAKGVGLKMREKEMRDWLSDKIGSRPINDCISRCNRIESIEKGLGIDLDNEYCKDGGRGIIEQLSYSRSDQESAKPLPGNIRFKCGSDVFNGMASIKSAVSKYFEFCCDFPPIK